MRAYEVEIEVLYREVYVVEAESKEEAEANWSSGDRVIAEAMYVEGIVDVREEEDF